MPSLPPVASSSNEFAEVAVTAPATGSSRSWPALCSIADRLCGVELAAERIDEGLGDRVEGPEPVVGEVADRVLEVARVAERVALVGVDRRLEAGEIARDEEVADGAEDLAGLAVSVW